MAEKRRLLELHKPMTGEHLTFETRQYYVTSDGMVWDGNRKRYLKQTEMSNGYLTVSLTTDNGKISGIGLHVLVASVFLRLLNKGEVVHHISHVKTDNRLENLEILDAKDHVRIHNIENWKNGRMEGVGAKTSEKMKKAWADGRIKTKNVGSDYRPAKQVAQIGMDGRLVRVWPSTAECQRNGFSSGCISCCCRNCFNRPGNNVYKGFKWMFLTDYLASQHDTVTSSQPVQLDL